MGGYVMTAHADLLKPGERGKAGVVRGKPGEWKLVYQTPAAIVEMPIPFEFKDLAHP